MKVFYHDRVDKKNIIFNEFRNKIKVIEDMNLV